LPSMACHKMCVLIFSTKLFENISHSKMN